MIYKVIQLFYGNQQEQAIQFIELLRTSSVLDINIVLMFVSNIPNHCIYCSVCVVLVV